MNGIMANAKISTQLASIIGKLISRLVIVGFRGKGLWRRYFTDSSFLFLFNQIGRQQSLPKQ
jgi:hypothetical protein